MTTNYEPIAQGYQQSKQQPWRTFVERFTLLELIGGLGGQSVLDLACGEGYYSRAEAEPGSEQQSA